MVRSVQVSVIIPVYNQKLYVGRCIRSLLKQTLPSEEFELIVINDDSSDGSKEAIMSFMGDIRYFENKKRLGLSGSLNLGIKNSRGQYVVRVDADDYVHSEYLNILSMHLQMNHDIDAVACDYQLVNNHQDILVQKNCLEEPIGCGIMFRIDQLIDIGLYDENFWAREEEDLRIRFLKKYSISRVQLPLYRYRKHEDNLSNNRYFAKKYARVLNKKHK